MMILTLLISSAFAAPINISLLQKSIEAKGLKWTAKENWVTKLSVQERKRLLGAEAAVGNVEDDYLESMNAPVDAHDWHNVNGVDYMGPVMNQGNCGSCVAFATVTTLQGQMTVTSGQPWYHPSYSPQALFGCGGGTCDGGWLIGQAANFVVKNGVVDNACLPYTSGSTGKDVACKSACANAGQRTLKALSTNSYGGIFGGATTSQIIAALKKGPLITRMNVYKDFMAYSGGIYKSTSNEQEGGHAISLVGYNATEKYWIIKNSWGEDWGEKGYARISWSDKSGIGSAAQSFILAKDANYVNIISPMDGTYISDLSSLKIAHATTTTEQINTVLKNKKTNVTYNLDCTQATKTNCVAAMEKGIPDGEYEVYAQKGTKRSVYQRLFVVNKAPGASIKVLTTGVDLANLKDRIEMDVITATTSVPLENIELIVEDMSKKEVYKRKQGDVLSQMKIGFRTTNVPNGTYKMYIRGNITVKGKVYSTESAKMTITIKNKVQLAQL